MVHILGWYAMALWGMAWYEMMNGPDFEKTLTQ